MVVDDNSGGLLSRSIHDGVEAKPTSGQVGAHGGRKQAGGGVKMFAGF